VKFGPLIVQEFENMNPRRLKCAATALIFAFSVPAVSSAQRRTSRQLRYQTEFGYEGQIRRKVKVPRYVIEQMIRSERAEGFSPSADTFASNVDGSLVNLNDDGRDDLLVRADPGANIIGFWLFRNTGRRWELVLYTVTLGLSIEKKRTNGFHDIEITAASAAKAWVALYKFDGTKYKPRGCWEHDLGVGKNGEWGPAKPFPCSGGDVKPY
jgi:hypothetical protein